jgi:hypothetical protein
MGQAPRKKTMKELKNEAIAGLENRGYDVRGKTPAQIRMMLRARPPTAYPLAVIAICTLIQLR